MFPDNNIKLSDINYKLKSVNTFVPSVDGPYLGYSIIDEPRQGSDPDVPSFFPPLSVTRPTSHRRVGERVGY